MRESQSLVAVRMGRFGVVAPFAADPQGPPATDIRRRNGWSPGEGEGRKTGVGGGHQIAVGGSITQLHWGKIDKFVYCK